MKKTTEVRAAEPPPTSTVAATTGQILSKLSSRQEPLVRLPHRKVSILYCRGRVGKIEMAKLFLREEQRGSEGRCQQKPGPAACAVCWWGRSTWQRSKCWVLALLFSLNSNILLQVPNHVSPFWFPSALLCSFRRTAGYRWALDFVLGEKCTGNATC